MSDTEARPARKAKKPFFDDDEDTILENELQQHLSDSGSDGEAPVIQKSPAKSKKRVATAAPTELSSDDDLIFVSAAKAPPAASTSKKSSKTDVPSKKKQKLFQPSDSEAEAKPKSSANKAKGKAVAVPDQGPDWAWKYIGDFVAKGWLTCSSNIVKLARKEAVTLELSRLKDPPLKKGKTAPPASKVCLCSLSFSARLTSVEQKKENILVRFRNKKGFEAGRIVGETAVWVSKLLDLDVIKLSGTVTDVPASFTSGKSISSHVHQH